MDQFRTNVKAIVNVSFKRNEGYYQYSFYVENDSRDYIITCNSIIAVAKMMNAVSIYQYIHGDLYIIDPLGFDDVNVDEATMRIVYDSFTSGKANNIFL